MVYNKKYILTALFVGFSLSLGLEAFSVSDLWAKVRANPGKTALAVTAVAVGLWAAKSYFCSEKSVESPGIPESNRLSSDNGFTRQSPAEVPYEHQGEPFQLHSPSTQHQNTSVNQIVEIEDWQHATMQIRSENIDLQYRTGNGFYFVQFSLQGKEYGLFNADLFVLACDIATYIEQYSCLGHVETTDIESALNQLFLQD